MVRVLKDTGSQFIRNWDWKGLENIENSMYCVFPALDAHHFFYVCYTTSPISELFWIAEIGSQTEYFNGSYIRFLFFFLSQRSCHPDLYFSNWYFQSFFGTLKYVVDSKDTDCAQISFLFEHNDIDSNYRRKGKGRVQKKYSQDCFSRSSCPSQKMFSILSRNSENARHTLTHKMCDICSVSLSNWAVCCSSSFMFGQR